MNLFYLFFFGSMIFFLLFIMTWMIFGKLIMLQIKRWMLASKGYVELEHISPTKIRNYFIVKPSENHFDINNGFFHYIPECITRKGEIIRKFDKAYLSKVPEVSADEVANLSEKDQAEYKNRINNEWSELKAVFNTVSKMNYDPQSLNRKWGMPVITYYGDNPDPINPSERDKSYGSGVIKDMYLRLLLTQRYKDFRVMMLVGLVALCLIAVSLWGFWQNTSSLVKANTNCFNLLNSTQVAYDRLVNETLVAKLQGSFINT